MKKFSLLILASIISLQAFAKLDTDPKQGGAFPFRIFFLSMKIKSHAIVEDRLIGRSAKKSKQYIRAQKLGELASDKKLIKYCESKSPTLRAYSYALLCKRKDSHLLEILSKHQTDSICVETFGGCISSSMSVFEYMFYHFEELVEDGEYQLSSEEQIIFTKLEDVYYEIECVE